MSLGGGFPTILVTACVRCYAVLNIVIYKVRINEMDETQPKVQYWSFKILFPFFLLLTTIFPILLVINHELGGRFYFSIVFIRKQER